MKLNYSNIIIIVIASLFIAFTFNYFNKNGINFLEGKKKFVTANDSLINALTLDTLKSIIKTDSANSTSEDNSSMQNNDIKQIDLPKLELTNSTEKNKNQLNESDSQSEFSEPHSINIEQAYKLFLQGILFIDARNKSDYDYSHIKNSLSLPVFQFEDYNEILKTIDVNQPIVVYCNGPDCDMSDMLANKLYELGYHKLFVFTGGWEEWENAKYPSEPVR